MLLLRSYVYFVAMVLTVILIGVPLGLFGWLFPTRFSDWMATAWGRSNILLQRWICGLTFEVKGAEHLPAQGAAMIMAKHQSTWETIALRGYLRPDQSWILKKELMGIPVFGWGLKLVESIPIDRKAGRKAVIQLVKLGLDRLEKGRLVIVFPEGTRTAPGSRKKYAIGGAVLAEKARVPVVPIAHNAGVFWKRRGVKKYPGTIEVRVGPAIDTHGKKASEIIAEVEQWIEAQQAEMPLQLQDH